MTHLQISADLSYRLPASCTMLVQVEVAATRQQRLDQSRITIGPSHDNAIIPALDRIGTRLWTRQQQQLTVAYAAEVTINRANPDLPNLSANELSDLPGETVSYLFDSHYCAAGDFDQLLSKEFSGLTGGALIAAMSDHVAEHMTYGSDVDNASPNARQSYAAAKGVCRDYAHILISMARAADIPARFVSTYAPDVEPQDFHAVAEVYLDGGWHLVDATGMAKPADMAVIGVGRDATDVAFLTGFGSMDMVEQQVRVSRA